MNIQYRIVKVDPESHGIVIRYFTDIMTEMDLASSFNEDGSVKLNADGYPVSTRTDVLMSIYQTPTPSMEEIEKQIMMSAPVDWLRLQESIKDPDIDTRMKQLRDVVGDSKSFTTDDINQVRTTLIAEAQANRESGDQDNLLKAYDTVVNLIDALKVLSEKDPEIIKDFIKVLGR